MEFPIFHSKLSALTSSIIIDMHQNSTILVNICFVISLGINYLLLDVSSKRVRHSGTLSYGWMVTRAVGMELLDFDFWPDEFNVRLKIR